MRLINFTKSTGELADINHMFRTQERATHIPPRKDFTPSAGVCWAAGETTAAGA